MAVGSEMTGGQQPKNQNEAWIRPESSPGNNADHVPAGYEPGLGYARRPRYATALGHG